MRGLLGASVLLMQDEALVKLASVSNQGSRK